MNEWPIRDAARPRDRPRDRSRDRPVHSRCSWLHHNIEALESTWLRWAMTNQNLADANWPQSFIIGSYVWYVYACAYGRGRVIRWLKALRSKWTYLLTYLLTYLC